MQPRERLAVERAGPEAGGPQQPVELPLCPAAPPPEPEEAVDAIEAVERQVRQLLEREGAARRGPVDREIGRCAGGGAPSFAFDTADDGTELGV